MKPNSLSSVLGADVPLSDVQASTFVAGIAYRSDRVRPGDVFFCIQGFVHDGHDFASDAVRRGAVAVVVQRIVDGVDSAIQIVVPDTRASLAYAAATFLDHPSSSVRIVGVTGTNGKTTTTYLVDSIMRAAGVKTGVIGTVGTRIGDTQVEASRTTPESADLQALLARMRNEGVDTCAMEVSSHAIDLRRVDGVKFAVTAFTNLTQDHLDYHHTIEEYFSVKRRLFAEHDVAARVVNIDDPLGAAMAAELGAEMTVGMAQDADVRAIDLSLSANGSVFTLVTTDGKAQVTLPLAAEYNVSNALVAAGCALSLGVSLQEVVQGLENAQQIPGRLERIDEGQEFAVLVDYAHTPDSLEKAILAVKQVTEGRVIVVFGAGGDRDPEKRPLMGRAAAMTADHLVITSDNPRSEDPVGIILHLQDGLAGTDVSHETHVDRREAIAVAFRMARPGDAVLIAGKGHEDYQIFSDRTVHFDDREVAREELSRLC